MEKTYYYSLNGQQQGPVTLAELKGKGITRESLIWTEGMAQWQQAQTLPELSELFTYGPQTPPTQTQIPQAYPTNATTETTVVTRPKTWLVESIIVTVLCCIPFGIVGIVYASKVDPAFERGDVVAAQSASKTAKTWVIAGAATALAGWIIYSLCIMIIALAEG
ncbi:CD225/dispanin family protein [uncultured Porphyromonas sp.]|uniref:CD225/dispanin family protein n=1 Tax=uncultured Porphyromonas sp. TaxID=159274 RepID=UPI0026016394|nr:CD225/dispanin family protein [uncultured Porphyromonas sp.]